jgi:hypothetical protein
VLCELSKFRRQDGNNFVSVPAIDAEVSIQRENKRVLMQLTETDNGGIGEGHRNVAIATHQSAERETMIVELNSDDEQARVGQRKQIIGFKSIAAEQERSFRQDRFTREEWARESHSLLSDPSMLARIGVNQSHQYAGIGNNLHLPKPSMWLGLVARSGLRRARLLQAFLKIGSPLS